MIGDIFYWMLNASIFGSITGLIVLLLRRIRALPRFGIYLLWLLPFIRLWVPAGIASPYSLFGLFAKPVSIGNGIITGSPVFSFSNTMMAAESYFPITYKTAFLKTIFQTAGMVWLIIAAAALLCSVVLYGLTKSAVKDAVPVRGNLYRSDKLLSPAVYGIVKPKIILPASLAEKDEDYIVKHEQIHIQRRDNFWRIAAVITACVHWFNPLAWLLLKYFFADMELACDAGVLKKLDDTDKKAYASALLACATGKTYYASAFGGAKTRLRIENILSYKKLTLFSGIGFAALFLTIAVAVLTNAAGG